MSEGEDGPVHQNQPSHRLLIHQQVCTNHCILQDTQRTHFYGYLLKINEISGGDFHDPFALIIHSLNTGE